MQFRLLVNARATSTLGGIVLNISKNSEQTIVNVCVGNGEPQKDEQHGMRTCVNMHGCILSIVRGGVSVRRHGERKTRRGCVLLNANPMHACVREIQRGSSHGRMKEVGVTVRKIPNVSHRKESGRGFSRFSEKRACGVGLMTNVRCGSTMSLAMALQNVSASECTKST